MTNTKTDAQQGSISDFYKIALALMQMVKLSAVGGVLGPLDILPTPF